MPKTRKNRNQMDYSAIQHHHFLLRMEMKTCPASTDKAKAKSLIQRIVKDIHMHLLDIPRVYYVSRPIYNEGLTAIAPIQTSHIAFHFWKNPEPAILKSRVDPFLLQIFNVFYII
jgi:S-adenosylmethionine/arginine decarboxylase-like enzyme